VLVCIRTAVRYYAVHEGKVALCLQEPGHSWIRQDSVLSVWSGRRECGWVPQANRGCLVEPEFDGKVQGSLVIATAPFVLLSIWTGIFKFSVILFVPTRSWSSMNAPDFALSETYLDSLQWGFKWRIKHGRTSPLTEMVLWAPPCTQVGTRNL